MTAETDLLPLPSEFGHPSLQALGVVSQNYARACVSSATEALRAEVDRLLGINSGLCRTSNFHLIDAARWEERAKRAEARAERLEGALLHLRNHTSVNSHQIELIDTALHPTAAQEEGRE